MLDRVNYFAYFFMYDLQWLRVLKIYQIDRYLKEKNVHF